MGGLSIPLPPPYVRQKQQHSLESSISSPNSKNKNSKSDPCHNNLYVDASVCQSESGSVVDDDEPSGTNDPSDPQITKKITTPLTTPSTNTMTAPSINKNKLGGTDNNTITAPFSSSSSSTTTSVVSMMTVKPKRDGNGRFIIDKKKTKEKKKKTPQTQSQPQQKPDSSYS